MCYGADMRQVLLGPTDIKTGAIAYGCWRFAQSTVQDADAKIRAALDLGMTLIDTADIYGLGEPSGFGGAEAVLGEVLQADPGLRDKMVLATKGGIIPPRPYDSSYGYLMSALEKSLTRLKTDYFDLYQIHRPDLIAPFSEQARALDDMVMSGKVRYVGVSNFTAAQTRALQAHLSVPIITLQPEISALEQSAFTDGVLDYASETEASVLAWSPLAGGRLATGRAGESDDPNRFERVMSALDNVATTHEVSRSQAALAFLMFHQSGIIPIIGTQKPKRMQEAAGAAELNLSARDFYDLVEAYRGVPMP